MGKISQGPAIRVTARLKGCRLNQNCSDEPTRNKEDTHDKRCGEQQFFRVANPVPTDERHYGHPVSNPDSPSASLGNMITDTASMSQTQPCWCQSCCFHPVITWGCFSTSTTATETTTRLSVK